MPEGVGNAPSCPHYPPALLLLDLYDVETPGAAGRRRFALTSPMEGRIVGSDMFWTSKKEPMRSEEMVLLGRLAAQVESLELKWTLYRAEIKKLVNRLEKQWERQERKLREEVEESMNNPNNGDLPIVDEVSARVNARRQRHGLHGE